MGQTGFLVVGAAGRMGRTLIKAIHETDGARVAGAVERAGSAGIGLDAGTLAGVGQIGVTIIDDADAACKGADVIVDFSTPDATREFNALALRHGLAHVVGTTGLQPEDYAGLRAAGERITVVQSGNMSLGVNLIAALVRQAAARLGPAFDIEVLEMHHRMKVDAPSGTALLLGEAAAQGRGVALADASVRVRDGHTGARVEGTIGFATLRGGSVVGDHSVIFAGPSERITISHHAEDRALFAHGAVKAGLWAHGRPPGFHSMADVLGL